MIVLQNDITWHKNSQNRWDAVSTDKLAGLLYRIKAFRFQHWVERM